LEWLKEDKTEMFRGITKLGECEFVGDTRTSGVGDAFMKNAEGEVGDEFADDALAAIEPREGGDDEVVDRANSSGEVGEERGEIGGEDDAVA
jgi:hypothetical protein